VLRHKLRESLGTRILSQNDATSLLGRYTYLWFKRFLERICYLPQPGRTTYMTADMTTKRKTAAVPVVGTNFVTDERPTAMYLTVQSEDDFFAGAAKRVREFRKGRRTRAVARVSFESVEVLLEVLTPRRYALMSAVKQKGSFDSIESLADELQRDRGTVSRDLKTLAEAGLISLRKTVLPGQGRRFEIAPVARE
jgi:predicted transcriptional regulator